LPERGPWRPPWAAKSGPTPAVKQGAREQERAEGRGAGPESGAAARAGAGSAFKFALWCGMQKSLSYGDWLYRLNAYPLALNQRERRHLARRMAAPDEYPTEDIEDLARSMLRRFINSGLGEDSASYGQILSVARIMEAEFERRDAAIRADVPRLHAAAARAELLGDAGAARTYRLIAAAAADDMHAAAALLR